MTNPKPQEADPRTLSGFQQEERYGNPSKPVHLSRREKPHRVPPRPEPSETLVFEHAEIIPTSLGLMIIELRPEASA
jgi:hypothetical protein